MQTRIGGWESKNTVGCMVGKLTYVGEDSVVDAMAGEVVRCASVSLVGRVLALVQAFREPALELGAVPNHSLLARPARLRYCEQKADVNTARRHGKSDVRTSNGTCSSCPSYRLG